MDTWLLYFLLGILLGAVPVTIIFLTLRLVRKKTETASEKNERKSHKYFNLAEQLKSVEEDRIKKQRINKPKN